MHTNLVTNVLHFLKVLESDSCSFQRKFDPEGILNYPYFPLIEIIIYFSNVKYSHDFTKIILLLLYVTVDTELYISCVPRTIISDI